MGALFSLEHVHSRGSWYIFHATSNTNLDGFSQQSEGFPLEGPMSPIALLEGSITAEQVRRLLPYPQERARLVLTGEDAFIALPANGIQDEERWAWLVSCTESMGYERDPYPEYGPDLGFDDYGYVIMLYRKEEALVNRHSETAVLQLDQLLRGVW